MNYNTTPLPRILNGKDAITGYKLVLFHKTRKKYRPNSKIAVCRSGEEHLVENYELAKKDNFIGWICHHRLELTLDGEFANSTIDLVNKDMYYHRPHFELIWLRREEHTRLHLSGNKHPLYGKGYLQTGDKAPNWKGGITYDRIAYRIARKAKKRALRNLPSDFQANTH